MKKNLRNILMAGTLGLAIAGCKEPALTERLVGKVNGNHSEVLRLVSNHSKRRVTIKETRSFVNPQSSGYLVGWDFNGDGNFEKIILQGVDVEEIKKLKKYFENQPLRFYANSDSLNLVYHEVLRQNGRKK